MSEAIDRAMAAAEMALAGTDRQEALECWSRLAGLLDLEARGDSAERVQTMVLRLQAWFDAH